MRSRGVRQGAFVGRAARGVKSAREGLSAADELDDFQHVAGGERGRAICGLRNDLAIALDGEDGWSAQRWFDAMAPYFEEHGTLGTGPDARNPALLVVDEHPIEHPGCWLVSQILDDPAGDRDWRITAEVDLAASDQSGRAIVRILAAAPHT